MILQIFSGYTARITAVLMVSTILVACDENGEFTLGQPKDDAETVATSDEDAALNPTEVAPEQRFVEKEVEAPEVFSKTGKALWDGRPSLGGVWVAHTDAKQPERVVIRNPANGKKVVGALFRRERSNPGPAFQLSSDAASALGVLAGSPQELSVTALRTKKVAVEPLIKLGKRKKADDPKAVPAPEAVASTSLTEPVKPTTTAAAPAPQAGVQTLQKPLPRPKTAAKVATAAPKPAAPVKAGGNARYAQMGLFSVEANANRTLAMLKKNGVNGKVVKSTASEKTFWRVLAGPAESKAAQDALLKKVKAMGFNDAYLVKG